MLFHVLEPDRIAGRFDEIHHRRGNAEFKILGCLPETGDVPDVLGTEASG